MIQAHLRRLLRRMAITELSAGLAAIVLGALALQAGLGIEELTRPGLGADGSGLGRLPERWGDLGQFGDVRGRGTR